MTRTCSPLSARVLVALAILASLVPAAVAEAQRLTPSPEALRFVGAHSGMPPQESIEREALALLVACRRPVTLGQVLAQGVAFRSSRIAELQSAGLLRQTGQQFVATVPVWTADEVAELDAALDALAEPVVTAMVPEFQALLRRLEQLGYPEAMPALAAWIVYERTWEYLVGTGMVDVRALVERQRQSHPNRGWWGVLWYQDGDVAVGQQLATRTDRDRTMLLAWSRDAAPSEMDPANPYGWMARVSTAIRNDRLEVRNRESLEDLMRQGLLGEEGGLRAPLVKWESEQEDSLAVAVQATVEVLAVTASAHLASEWAPGVLPGADPVVVRTIAYQGLAPRLLAGLQDAGVRALVDMEGPATTRVAIMSEDGESGSEQRPRRLSMFFWKELPVEMQRAAFPLR